MNAIKEVIDGILEVADKERKASEPYKDMFKRTNAKPFPVQLMTIEGEMIGVLLNYSTILNEHGYKIDDNLWKFLLALPLLAHILEKDIIAKEGHVCSTDKVYKLLHQEFMKLLKPIE
jgi:hypothetical protein